MDIDLQSILPIFISECEEHLARMEQSLLELENTPSDQNLVEALFRGAHTIKGNAAALGYAQVAAFAHAFEELLQNLRGKVAPIPRETITLSLQSVDALRQMIPDAISGATEFREQHRGLLIQLNSLIDAANFSQPVLALTGSKPKEGGYSSSTKEPTAKIERSQTVRVEVQKLDRMLNLASEIATGHENLRQAIEAASPQIAEISEAQSQLERLSMSLQEQIMKSRMVPLGPIFRQYVRTVRDLAQHSDKNARLEIVGDEVELDLSMVERLKDPLTHLIRNAFDHGLECPDMRRSRGKDPCGVIALKALHDGSSIVIQVTDDGAGLDRRRIATRARAMGLAAEPEKLRDQDLLNLIFVPGFSTAEKISDLSGRGVGMDVVRRNIEALRGTICLESHPGEGTTVTIRLPLTLLTIEGFAVGIAGDIYILPLEAVIECVELPKSSRRPDGDRGLINLRGEPLPYVCLCEWFGLTDHHATREHVVVIDTGNGKTGLVVNALYGATQIVIKPLGKRFQGLQVIAGSAILGNGRVALILDVDALVNEVMHSRTQVKNRAATSRTDANEFIYDQQTRSDG